MASWGRSFILAIKAFIFSIVWMLIGGGLIFFGFSVGGGDMLLGDFDDPDAITGLIFLLLGYFILAFGSIASIIKVITDYVGR